MLFYCHYVDFGRLRNEFLAIACKTVRDNICADVPQATKTNTSYSNSHNLTFFFPPTMSSPPTKSKPGHSRHETALIHGLSSSEVQKLSEACVEAKAKAYCQHKQNHKQP